jgi:hypothetical protein
MDCAVIATSWGHPLEFVNEHGEPIQGEPAKEAYASLQAAYQKRFDRKTPAAQRKQEKS